MIEGYDGFKDNAPGASGLAVKTQAKNWAVPSQGRVKAMKEAGAWSDDQEKYNNALLKRQDVLIAAWNESMKAIRRRFREIHREWMAARKAALTKANLIDTFS